jgi:tripartite motif-containing protein 71
MIKHFMVVLTLILGFNNGLQSQTVSKLAGQQYIGNGKYSGIRNNLKDSVWFSAPYGIELDTAGRIYVSNEHNVYLINGNNTYLCAGYSLDPNGAGSVGSVNSFGSVARFNTPSGICVNKTTNELLIADLGNNLIRKMEPFSFYPQQGVSTFAGTVYSSGSTHTDGANATSRFSAPIGIAVASNGDVYVADRDNHCIRKISGGSVTTIAGSAGNSGNVNGIGSVARFSVPYNVFIDGNNLLVCDYGNSAIRKINLSNNEVTDLITTGLFGPRDICRVGSALMIAEQLCIKKYENNVLSVYVGNANLSGYVNAEGTASRFEDITSVVYDQKKKLMYVVDMGNNVVRSISPDFKPVSNFTTSSQSATQGQTIILKSTSSNSPTAYRWTITPSSTFTLLNNSKLTDSVIYISFSQAGAYSIKLWVSNSTGADSLLKNNHIAVSSVTAAPVANFSASKLTPIPNETIELIDLSTNAPTTWKWRISPSSFEWIGSNDSTVQFPKVKFLAEGKYTITLIASNGQGSHSATKSDFINSQLTSTRVLNTPKTSIYPNPCVNELNIKLNDLNASIVIRNNMGQALLNFIPSEINPKIDLSAYQSGIYFIEIKNPSTVEYIKFIIQR